MLANMAVDTEEATKPAVAAALDATEFAAEETLEAAPPATKPAASETFFAMLLAVARAVDTERDAPIRGRPMPRRGRAAAVRGSVGLLGETGAG
jgi:hypothetical protein